MECPHTYQPQLDETGTFWNKVQAACLHAFSNVHWHSGESHWYFSACKNHTIQAVLRKALSEEAIELASTMKRGPEAGQEVLYAFSIDPALKYQLTPGERDFLKKLNLEDFISSNSWGVLHSQLVTEAIAALELDTFLTTVKGEKVQLIAQDWREQFKRTFHLTKKEVQPVTKQWQLTELFPTLKANPESDTVRISDCQHPGARRPLRLLSSIFCLNPTHQNHITLAFVEMIVAALNGQEADWPQEFYHEITEELTTLHNKHLAKKVKVEKTSIGPHLTLILKAGGMLNIREELEAGYRSEKALTLEEQRPTPKKSKTLDAERLPETQTTIRLKPPRQEATTTEPRETAPVYSVTTQPTAAPSAAPARGIILETTEPRQPPKVLPAMVEQICQAHRRLENLLFSFIAKAPPKLVNHLNNEFFKVQRTATLGESKEGHANEGLEVLLKFQEVQLRHLTQQLSNSDSLNDINIEATFRLEEELATFRNKWEQAKEEVLALREQKSEVLEQLSNLQTTIDKQARLEAKLTNAEELIDLYVEQSFETQTLLADQEKEVAGLKMEIQAATHRNQEELNTLQEKLMLAEEEVLGLKAQKGEALHRINQLQQVIDTQKQQLQDKDREISDLDNHSKDMDGVIKRQDALDIRRRGDLTRLESQVTDYQQEIEQLKEENHKLKAQISAGEGEIHLPSYRGNLDPGRSSTHPIMNKERHPLTAGVANKLLNELRRDLARTQQENTDLAQQLLKQHDESRENTIPHTSIHPRTEMVQCILKHTEPFDSIMQYHQVYGKLNLLLNNLPLLKTGCKLEFAQMKEIWNQANAATRDTLVFMWCLGEIKTPLGVMEMLTASPPFYIKRYILRCIKLLAQHRNMTRVPRESLPTLKSYSHGQFHLIRRMQQNYTKDFNQALSTLAAEDTAICFEAVQHYQAVANQHPTLQPNLSQVKDFVNSTLEAQQSAISHRYFGALNSGTILFQPRSQSSSQQASTQSMGTCFL